MGQKKDAVDLKTDVINKAQSDNAKAVQQSMDGMMKQIIDFLKSMQDAKAEWVQASPPSDRASPCHPAADSFLHRQMKALTRGP